MLLGFSLISYIALSQVRADYDKNTDFTRYKTYTFQGWEKDSDQQLNDFDKKRITDAFKHELEIRGFTYDNSNPDVGITLFVVVDQRTIQPSANLLATTCDEPCSVVVIAQQVVPKS